MITKIFRSIFGSKNDRELKRLGKIVKQIAELHGGGGGGRPDKARAGIKGKNLKDQIAKDLESILT